MPTWRPISATSQLICIFPTWVAVVGCALTATARLPERRHRPVLRWRERWAGGGEGKEAPGGHGTTGRWPPARPLTRPPSHPRPAAPSPRAPSPPPRVAPACPRRGAPARGAPRLRRRRAAAATRRRPRMRWRAVHAACGDPAARPCHDARVRWGMGRSALPAALIGERPPPLRATPRRRPRPGRRRGRSGGCRCRWWQSRRLRRWRACRG